MQVIYKKQRSAEYRYELENEYERLMIAKKFFQKIITPHRFKLNDLTLTTEKIGAGASTLFKKHYPPQHFIEEYLRIIRKLWDESLDIELKLTPKWVKEPILKNSIKLLQILKIGQRMSFLEYFRENLFATKKIFGLCMVIYVR